MKQEQFDNHEERITRLEENDAIMSIQIAEIQEDLRERYDRIDESNKYLRDLSLRQNEQNSQILNAVLKGNQDSKEREDKLKETTENKKSEFWVAAVGSGGIIAVLIELLTNFLK
ncbi:hypothetical protein CL176_02035 [Suicoccus acidiformans]|uniref:Uncharacterized protein n=1 Tax=Suicoccus acidiformans TaxID=2036206 RepID=A0A347WIJ1_9LACT|nr:hypothetical protein [Suicoccus acidiformans]AXY24898.1 hypothetical protein CL176_02035 [Suicoccus acidiformans]